MEKNEKRFVSLIVEFEDRLATVREHIRSNYNINCEFDEENGILNLFPINSDAEKNILSAQKYANKVMEGSITYNPPLPESENPYWE